MKIKKVPKIVKIFKIIQALFLVIFIGGFHLWYFFSGYLPDETPIYLILFVIIGLPILVFVSGHLYKKYRIPLNIVQMGGMKYYETKIDLVFFIVFIVLVIISFFLIMHSVIGTLLALYLYVVFFSIFLAYYGFRYFRKKKGKELDIRKVFVPRWLKIIIIIALLVIFLEVFEKKYGSIVFIVYLIAATLYLVYRRYKKGE